MRPTSEVPRVRLAGPDDSAALIAALARAFDEDPIMNWFLRQDDGRTQAFYEFFRFIVNEQAMPHGCVLTTEDYSACALWIPPHQWRLSIWKQMSILPAMIRGTGWAKLRRAFHGFAQMDKHHPEAPHYYLPFIGVAPAYRGQGYASALVRPVLERCDREGVGAYLENTNPANTALYERFGFRTTGPIDLGAGAPPYSSMWRTPRSPGQAT